MLSRASLLVLLAACSPPAAPPSPAAKPPAAPEAADTRVGRPGRQPDPGTYEGRLKDGAVAIIVLPDLYDGHFVLVGETRYRWDEASECYVVEGGRDCVTFDVLTGRVALFDYSAGGEPKVREGTFVRDAPR